MTADQSEHGEVTVEDHGVKAIATSLAWFEARLQSSSIQVRPDSGLGKGLQTLRDLRAKSRVGATEVKSIEAAQRWFLDASGTDYLTKSLHRGELSGLRGFQSHWRMLKAGNPILTGPAGNPSRERNMAWELVIASWVATLAKEVHEAEPDVVCSYLGRRIGLAGKVLYGSSSGQFLDNIKNGAEQIQRADVDVGFVILNMVEVFPHVAMFRSIHQARVSSAGAVAALVAAWVDAFLVQYDAAAWARRLKGMSKLVSVMMFIPTVLPLAGWPMPMPYYRFHTFEIIGQDEIGQPFQNALQIATQDAVAFRAPTA